jgi:hypothetical protein
MDESIKNRSGKVTNGTKVPDSPEQPTPYRLVGPVKSWGKTWSVSDRAQRPVIMENAVDLNQVRH